MAETNRKTITIDHRRAEGEEGVKKAGRHFAAMLLEKGLTVDALGSDDVPLRREGDNRDAILAAVRAESAKMANFTVTECPDKVVAEPVAPPSSETSLDNTGVRKVHALFESAEAGYQGYALQVLKKGNIDPENLLEGSAPLWESPEAALNELLANLTPEMLEVIDRDYTTPAITIEPVMNHGAVYIKNDETKDYDCRFVGNTPFHISEWAARGLNKVNQENKVGSIDGKKIVGWRIGIADKAKVTKVLATDGDITSKTLENRARDFHAEGGNGRLGFVSVVDHPVFYGLMINESRNEGNENIIDDVQAENGVWTMGTRVDSSGKYPRVAGGAWDRYNSRASLFEYSAGNPNRNARVRLAVMFNKS